MNVDPARVYMVGHSMAAHAAWNLALHYPTYFAAINPLAGAASGDWQRLRLSTSPTSSPSSGTTPTDDVIPVAPLAAIVAALRKQKLDVDYEETKKLGHAPTEEVVERRTTSCAPHARPVPRQVRLQSNRPDTMFNRNDWVQVYQSVRREKYAALLLRGSAC